MSRPARVAIVGGPDVDARLDLMARLTGEFELEALGTSADIAPAFAERGFAYATYPLKRRVDPIGDFRAIRHLRAALQRMRPDIVHTFDTKPGVFGAIAARAAGVPAVVGTITGLGSLYSGTGFKLGLVRWIYQRLQRAACRRSDLTIFQNRDDARTLVAAGIVPERKVAVILGSGVSTERFAPERVSAAERSSLRAELGLGRDDLVVTMIARATRTKGVPQFAAAARAVQARHPGVRFLLVGPADVDSLDRLDGGELAELRRSVLWPGARRDIPAVLAISSVFVLPTVYREGIPRVLLEAAAMGLPLVTTDSPGCNEVVAEGVNGLFVAAGDVAALAGAIERILADGALRSAFGTASRERAVALFDLEVVARQTRDLYRRLLDRNRVSGA